MTVRGVAQNFSIIDKNKNRLIDASELEEGLRQMGVNLVPEQVSALLAHFDKDGSGQIDLNEFMVAIRVSIFGFFPMFLIRAIFCFRVT